MIKVDIIYGGDINAPNGASVLMKKLNDALGLFASNGIEQHLYSPSLSGSTIKNGSTERQIKESLKKKVIRSISQYSLVVSYLRYRRSLVNPANRAIKSYSNVEDKGGVVVFHELWTCYEYLRKYNNGNKKVILIIHGEGKTLSVNMPRFDSVLMNHFRKQMHDTIINGCYRIGFDADLPRRNFCKINNFDENKSFYVYNGIEERPCPHIQYTDKLRLICVATLSDRKNQIGILNAIGMLDKKDQEKVNLVLVGDGPSRIELEAKARNLDAVVEFAGSMEEKEYYELMLKSNCFCLFSKSEGLPIAILEAMRAGLPIIGSRVDGIPEEIEDGKTGFVVELDERALSDRIKWILYHLDCLPEMGMASYNYFMKNFTTEAMVEKYVEVYKS